MRFVVFVGLSSLVVGCATAPGPGGAPSGAPPRLSVCAGGGISNAPPTDGRGRITGFDPIAYVDGTALLRAPVNGCVSSGFGPRRGGAGSFHEGLDLYTGRPRTVVSGGDGVIEFIGSQRGYGRTVTIRHSRSVKTRYAHLSSYAGRLREGARIRQGEPIGMTGATGNATAVHLHYEILVRGRPINPISAGR